MAKMFSRREFSLVEYCSKGWGSFFSESVEELISLDDDKYIPPSLPVKLPLLDDGQDELKSTKFGKEMRKKYFLLEDSFTFINHGIKNSLLTVSQARLAQ
jgi:hypothetical protein